MYIIQRFFDIINVEIEKKVTIGFMNKTKAFEMVDRCR